MRLLIVRVLGIHASPSTSISDRSMSIPDPPTSWDDIGPPLHGYYKPDLELDEIRRLLDIIIYYYML
jgi:hypothetical protein